MKKNYTQLRHPSPALLVVVLLLLGAPVLGQDPITEDRLKILTDPESLKQKVEKEKIKPPIEFFRSQIAPFDILPYMKANHWSTLSLEMRANYDDYVGFLRSSPVRLLGMPREGFEALEAPQEVLYLRDARLIKEQRARLSMQIMLPRIPKEVNIDLLRPEAIRADEVWPASLRVLEPHQMLILVLTKESNDPYARWNQFQALIPMSADRNDALVLDRQRYYRLVLPLDPEHLPLSSHPLTWSTLSHVIWDGMPPEMLQPQQQQVMLDWLHWGGQLILVGGAKPSFAALRESFLGPYLPADSTGDNVMLTEQDLAPLSKTYPPVVSSQEREDPRPVPNAGDPKQSFLSFVYKAPEPIRPASNRPLFCAGLRPRAGASVIPLGESSPHVLGVENRVGRGRILMLTINPTDPALSSWGGIDTLVRRVILRRPEDRLGSLGGWTGAEFRPPGFQALSGPDLSWFRYASRDVGASLPRPNPEAPDPRQGTPADSDTKSAEAPLPAVISQGSSVAEWVDSSRLPRLSRDILENASGITIPSSKFVLKVILAYIIALVPLNWLICRYGLRRREWAWVVVPALALGFAIGVERAAAYDVGYDAACDELNVLEMQGGYPRAHLSRFASLYTTGRVRFNISYPNDPSALALPQDNGRSLRGEDVMTSRWQSQPVPTLEGLQVQPRSLSLFRAEQMVNLPGAIRLDTREEPYKIVNATDLELRDAVLVEVGNGPDSERKETYLGTIGPGSNVVVKSVPSPEGDPFSTVIPNPVSILREFRDYFEDRPENSGEVRLVAWSPTIWGGQKIEPPIDRQRGVSVVVVHLRSGALPAPDGPRYNYLARDMGNVMSPPPDPPADEPLPGGISGAMRPKSSLRSRKNLVAPPWPTRAGVIPPSPRRVAR